MTDTFNGKPWEDLDTNPPGLPAWAKDKAREWIGEHWPGLEEYAQTPDEEASLAALLVDVAAVGEMVRAEDAEYQSTLRRDVLAEVRRMVERTKALYTVPTSGAADAALCCDQILAELDAL